MTHFCFKELKKRSRETTDLEIMSSPEKGQHLSKLNDLYLHIPDKDLL